MIRINLTLQGGPNHTTYEHPRCLVWQPFTSSFTRCATSYPNPRCLCIPTNTRWWAGCVSAWSPVPCPIRGGTSSMGVRHFKSVKYCMLRRFIVAHKHGMWLVQFNGWVKGQSRTCLNRHRRGYATKERVQRHVPFLVSGPIGLARSQFLTSINWYHHYSHHIISIILILKSYNSRVSEALDFYRYYSTKQSVRS